MLRSCFIILAVTSLALACGVAEQIKNGAGFLDKNTSIFQSYASDYCTLTNADESKKMRANCDHALQLTKADSSYCQKSAPFTIAKVYFPDRALPMRACQDLFTEDFSQRSLLRFAILGDTGAGESVENNFRQASVARALYQICPPRLQKQLPEDEVTQRSCDFNLVVGDIIYAKGLSDPWDSLLESRFEEPYRIFSPLKFFMIPGNHDYLGNRHTFVEASYFSDMWRIPHPFYAVKKLPSWVNLVGIDTSGLSGEDDAPQSHGDQSQLMLDTLCHKESWNIIFGHYPSFSNGKHGGHLSTRTILADVYNKCPFDLYLAGHDHHQELLKTNQYLQLVQGGGGAEVRDVSDKINTPYHEETAGINYTIEQLVAKKAHGFSIVELTQERLILYFYDINSILEVGAPGSKDFSAWFAKCEKVKGAALSCQLK